MGEIQGIIIELSGLEALMYRSNCWSNEYMNASMKYDKLKWRLEYLQNNPVKNQGWLSL